MKSFFFKTLELINYNIMVIHITLLFKIILSNNLTINSKKYYYFIFHKP